MTGSPARRATAELRAALSQAEQVLADAGVPSPRADAELLAAHLLGVDRGQLHAAVLRGERAPEGYVELVARRADRVPLQHLTGTAPFRHLELAVGPGVFVPRPETEQVAQVAIDAARAVEDVPVVVDLCTGTGAIALAVAQEVPTAEVYAVELDRTAHRWAERNVAALGDGRVRLVRGDARTALRELDATVDVVVSNPPYIPPDGEPLDPEVRDHDPEVALYGLGSDGLEVPRGIVAAAARLLAAGGLLVMEHAEVQAAAVRAMVSATGAFTDVRTRPDLTDRPRMVVARAAARGGSSTGVGDSRA